MPIKKSNTMWRFVFFSILVCSQNLLAQTSTFSSFPLDAPITGSFLIEYDAIPSGEKIDWGFTMFKMDAPAEYNDNAILIRFSDTGFCDARDGDSYTRLADVPYVGGENYHFKVAGEVNPSNGGTYSVWVTPPGGYETLIADGFGFRTAQANVDTLKNWGYFTIEDAGEALVSNVSMPAEGFYTVPLIPSLHDAMIALADTFALEFDATPRGDTLDFIVSLSKLETPTQWNDHSAMVRFADSGLLDVRNGDGYAKTADVPYERGKNYHFKVAGKVDPTNGGTYSVWVTPEDGDETQIADKFGFRTAQANVDTLYYVCQIIMNPSEWTVGGHATVKNIYLSYANNTADIYDEWFFESIPLGVSLTDSFVVEADAVPGADIIDCGFSLLKSDNPTEFNDNAVLVRLSDSGVFDVRNGDAYEKIADVPYEKNKKYHIKVAGSVPNSSSSVWITDPEGTETLIAENYLFRTAQIGVDALNNWGRFFAGVTGYAVFSNVTAEALSGTGVKSDPHNAVSSYRLEQNYPNPFNPTTTITYTIPVKSHVSIKVFNLLGEHIATLVDENTSAGNHSFEWNARDNFGNDLASGVYVYQIEAGNFVKCHKMLLLK